MTLTAPPGQAGPRDIVSHQVEAAVIEQARRRARRRRAATAGTIGLLLAAALALFALRDNPPTGRPSSDAGGELAAVGPGPRSAQLVDSYGIVHDGWVAAYADGRVIWHLEEAPYGTLDNLAERRLNEAGMARLRAGAIDWTDFLTDPAKALPPTAWAEPSARPYVPSSYAVCLEWVAADFTSSRALAVRELPRPARDVLEGRPLARRAFTSWHDPPAPTFTPPVSAWHCVEVDRAAITAMAGTRTIEEWGGTSRGITFFQYPDGSADVGRILPLLPHGEFDPAGG
jgi:hypothetical protein